MNTNENLTANAIEKKETKRYAYDPIWDVTRMTDAMGVTFCGRERELSPDGATVKLHYKAAGGIES